MTPTSPATVPAAGAPSPETIGQVASTIQVELSTRFLEHFSEQLYSSPQKAFEELISNGWDAGADCVDVRIPTDLGVPNASLCVLDNGASMDAEGLRQLWHIAFSPKQGKSEQYGRPLIGKFGIGKLATYVLADKLTYICRAADGKIRRVTMDYSSIDKTKGKDTLISNLQLELFEVTEDEVGDALATVPDGAAILNLIKKSIPRPAGDLIDDEFGADKSSLQKPPSQTWTLVVLSNLKPVGKELKIGVLRRMLEAALPFGSEMAISINGELLSSSKTDNPVLHEWAIGPDLELDSVEIDENEVLLGDADNAQASTAKKLIPIKSLSSPTPHVLIPGIGKITGRVRLFVDRVTGGKSEERGASNGFHINVLGRVINGHDPSFGEENLSHAAWARFRMTVRADGLNELLTTDRERFRENRDLQVFRAFLRRVFNKARNYYDSDANVSLSHGGDVLVRSLGVVSLNSLRNVVSDTLGTNKPPVAGLLDDSGIEDRAAKRASWRKNTADDITNALSEVKYEKLPDDSFVKFRISDNSIVVNRDHPFVAEHSRTKAEKELMRTVAMVNLLTDVYTLDIGVQPEVLENIRKYRDNLMRFRALQSRQSGTYIAKLLLQTQHVSDQSKQLEAVVSDALSYLGYSVKDLAKPGEPEGIASAFPYPTQANPTDANPKPPLYKFTFDAKSSKHEVAATNNINLAGVVEHRDRYKADHALVIAPGYSDGALAVRCEAEKVTPMTARDLGRLLEYTVEYGAIPLTKLREVFYLYDPTKVTGWVADLETWLKEKRPLTIDIFLKALEHLKGEVPDVLAASTVALVCRQQLKAVGVRDEHVIALVKGLSILIPDLVGIEQDKIIVNASSAKVAAAVATQLENLHKP
jgi:hypothetical protein